MTLLRIIAIAALLSGCTRSAATSGKRPVRAADSAAAPTRTVRPVPDSTAEKRGLPEGFMGRTDDGQRRLNEVRHRRIGLRFEITTGPSLIAYLPGDTLNGRYIIATTFDKMPTSAPTQGFGLFFGGSGLESSAQRYAYFLMRASGEYAIGVRDGDQVRDIVAWTAHPAVRKQSSEDRSTYRLAIRVSADSVHFLSTGTQVAALPRSALPTDGIFGLRLHQNLKVRVTQVRRTTS
jgi:hypothetical protein